MGADDFNFAKVALDNQHGLSIMSGGREYLTSRIADKTPAPEVDGRVSGRLQADSINRYHENTVGDSVASLNGLPGRMLAISELFFLRWQPADRSGIKQDAGALEGG